MAHIVVIGNGLAGTAAALAARETGAEVTLVARGFGRSTLSSGIIGLAGGMTTDRDVALSETLANLLKRRPRHPYMHLDAPFETLVDTAQWFAEQSGKWAMKDFNPDQPALKVLTEAGSTANSWFAARSLARVDTLAQHDRIGILALSGFPLFRAGWLSQAYELAFGDSSALDVIRVEFDLSGRPFDKGATLARFLDDDGHFEALADEIKTTLGKHKPDALIVPPVLGIVRPDGGKRLASVLGLDVYEAAPVFTPSVVGQRLMHWLSQRVEKNKVKRVNATVLGGIGSARKLSGVMLRLPDGSEKRLDADAIVLASGKYLGGGIAVDGRNFKESIFDLPVMLGGRRIREIFTGRITKPDVMKSQPMMRAGLATDDSLRPVDDLERVVFENLFAAGQVLGGFDPFTDGCAEGVDLVTGRLAGEFAGRGTP